jgi:uncharacterized protein (DUF305 family)
MFVMMAKMLFKRSSQPQIRNFAKAIIKSPTAEMQQMQ